MANNRMFLVHEPTGHRATLAKWSAGIGWCPDFSPNLGGLFDDDIGVVADTIMGTDSGPWKIKLEHD